MNTHLARRFQAEHRILEHTLPRLDRFVELIETGGTPPTRYLFEVMESGFLVQVTAASGPGEPEVFDRTRHGRIVLGIAADPGTYPFEPWAARFGTRPGVSVFNPHVLDARGPADGGLCWHVGGPGFVPAEWPAALVLHSVLMILAGHVELEGYALHEPAKLWFAEHRDRWPFADVPPLDLAPAAPRLVVPPADAESNLGIEFGA